MTAVVDEKLSVLYVHLYIDCNQHLMQVRSYVATQDQRS
jgi:hypothetical protein